MRTEILNKIKDLTNYVINLGSDDIKEEIKKAEVVDTTKEIIETPPAAKVEYVTVADFNKAIEDVKKLFSKQYQKFSEEKTALESKNVELQSDLDKKPDAIKLNHSPETKEVELKTSADRLLNAIQNAK